jgi:hypothetical protein
MLAEIGLEGLAALAITLGAPIVGGVALVYGLIAEGNSSAPGWRERPGDGGSPRPPLPPGGPPRGGVLPLPGAAPSPVRLRGGDDALADGYPRRTRRPEHVPHRQPAPAELTPAPVPTAPDGLTREPAQR